jgi:hypothetical protein
MFRIGRMQLALFCGADAGKEDRDEFVGFLNERLEFRWRRDDPRPINDFEPDFSFAEFLQCDFQLVDKIRR